MQRLFQALTTTADGAFVVDDLQRILFWNAAAATITGYSRAQAEGMHCQSIMDAKDHLGRPTCCTHCRMASMVSSGNTIPSVEMMIRTKRKGMRWINLTTVAYVAENRKTILVHLFRDVTRKQQRERFIRELRQNINSLSEDGHARTTRQSPPVCHKLLTPRESEVLTLLVRGRSNREIAKNLVISESTARNHVRHILNKLDVHSRLEAVSYAIEHGLIPVADM